MYSSQVADPICECAVLPALAHLSVTVPSLVVGLLIDSSWVFLAIPIVVCRYTHIYT